MPQKADNARKGIKTYAIKVDLYRPLERYLRKQTMLGRALRLVGDRGAKSLRVDTPQKADNARKGIKTIVQP